MSVLRQIRDHWVTLWILLCVPAVPLILGAIGPAPAWHMLLHVSGELSARLLVVVLVATPLVKLFGWRWARWLMARRRWLGVASFGYAALHLVFYAVHEGLLTDLFVPGILTGWAAFLIYVPLALTSNDASVRALGKRWKTLQRWTYLAAVFTLAHWILLEYELGPALVHAAPVLVFRGWAALKR